MSTATLTRAWSDVDFRSELSADALAALADNPAGDIDAELDQLQVQEMTGVTTNCTQWSRLAAPRRCCC